MTRARTGPAVVGAGASCGFGLFVTTPTDGARVVHHGFDGGGPGTLEVFQDIVSPGSGTITLSFDWRAGWNFTLGSPATIARMLDVVIEPLGGGAALGTFNILTTPTGPSVGLDTGAMSSGVDLSAFSGSGFRLNFVSTIPQFATGPAHFQLDNISLAFVPEPATAAILAIGFLGLGAARRRAG